MSHGRAFVIFGIGIDIGIGIVIAFSFMEYIFSSLTQTVKTVLHTFDVYR
jgi:hypothetical protein